MSEALDFYTRRVARDPAFMGYVLAEYARVEACDDEALAGILECTMDQLDHLRRCLRPRTDRFREDIDELANAFGLRASTLASIVRDVDTAAAMRADEPVNSASDSGALIAARDREPEHSPSDRAPE